MLFAGLYRVVWTCNDCSVSSCDASKEDTKLFRVHFAVRDYQDLQKAMGDDIVGKTYLPTNVAKECPTAMCSGKRSPAVEVSRLPAVLLVEVVRMSLNGRNRSTKKLQLTDNGVYRFHGETYELVGVINHTGTSSSSGHYTVLAAVGAANQCAPQEVSWKLFDDDVVKDVDIETMRTRAGAEGRLFVLRRSSSGDLLPNSRRLLQQAPMHVIRRRTLTVFVAVTIVVGTHLSSITGRLRR